MLGASNILNNRKRSALKHRGSHRRRHLERSIWNNMPLKVPKSTDHLCLWFLVCLENPSPHLYLLALEDRAKAGVKGSPREHGSDRVGQIQDLLKVRRHILRRKGIKNST